MTAHGVSEDASRDGGAPGAAVAALWDLTLLLRRECPWDRAQTAATIVPHTLEEAWEVADAARDAEQQLLAGVAPQLGAFEDELGDLLFQVCFLAMWCHEVDPSIDLGTVAERIHAKLVRRHPHVFADAAAAEGAAAAPATADEVRSQWDRIKRDQEQRSLFEGVPRSMPPLARARKVQSRAAGVGFDFAHVRDALAKLDEEVAELREAIDVLERSGAPESGGEERPADPRVEAEVGDVLFAATNVARLVRVDPDIALTHATRTFQSRVERAELLAAGAGERFPQLDLEAQERWYQQAKHDLREPSEDRARRS